MIIERQFTSADEFLKIVEQPEYDDRTVELVEGVIVEMSKPGGKHGQIMMRLSVRLGSYVEARDLGVATTGETGYVLERSDIGRDTVRGLDIAFIKKGRVPDELPESLLELAPDLAVEILSPSNKSEDILSKIRQLLQAGTLEVWLVYPRNRRVHVHTLDGVKILEPGDTLDGGDILPGLQIPVSDIFPS